MRSAICLYIFLLTGLYSNAQVVDKSEAEKAYELINDIRLNTQKYYSKYRFLKREKVAHTELKWNDTLARVAEQKAIDMAKNEYFNHIDKKGYGINYLINKAGYKLNPEWIKDKRTNYFESISAGSGTQEEAIERLIIDKSDPRKGHRVHLLGLDAWNGSLVDIGIAFVKAPKSEYKTYIVIIIAKHDW